MSRVWLDFWRGWIELWWFPEDNLDDSRKGRGYWQIGGHLFQDTLLDTAFSFGRYCGRSIANLFLHMDLQTRECFCPILKLILARKEKEV